MGIFDTIKRHAAVAAGNFPAMLTGVDIPPLPSAVTRLLAELRSADPDPSRILRMISTSPELMARVIRTVNSARFGLRQEVTGVRHALALLGCRQIRSIVLSYAVREALPRPRGRAFKHDAFWTDSLVRALLARGIARYCGLTSERAEEAFTAALIADLALPVLLVSWGDYYAPLLAQWDAGAARLSAVEGEQLGWTHAQAGAWMLQAWGFPDEIVCFVGAHGHEPAEIRALELAATPALPVAIACLLPSGLAPHGARAARLITAAREEAGLTPEQLADLARAVAEQVQETRELFGLPAAASVSGLEVLHDEIAGRRRPAA